MKERTNLDWYVDYDYDRSACTCDDWICRCTTIERAWVENVPVDNVIDKLYRTHCKDDSDINKYCFDRICHVFKIYDKDLYDIETGGGYYGEEVYGVYFEDEERIVDTFNEVLALDTDLEKIQYCLNLEYGYLIDCVKSATFAEIVETSPSHIYFLQLEYMKKIDRQIIEAYKNIELPIAVCFKDGDKYRLIDGYHRFAANKDRDNVRIIALE